MVIFCEDKFNLNKTDSKLYKKNIKNKQEITSYKIAIN